MQGGFWGKVLTVNLSSGDIGTREVPDELVKRFLGGGGIVAHWLLTGFDNGFVDPGDPLHPDQPLVVMTGLFVGTPLPTACKTTFGGKSPQTGIWNEAIVGGYFGQKLRAAGWDGIIITGQAEDPVYLWISPQGVELRPAEVYWGKDVYHADEHLRQATHPQAQTAIIGPAGENLVKIASIMIGGHEGRAAGRGGMGALMGAKHLKAIVVHGDQKVPVVERPAMMAATKETNAKLKVEAVGLNRFGTAGLVQGNEASGDMPIHNFRGGRFVEGAATTCGQHILESAFVKNYGCFACAIQCGKVITILSGTHQGEHCHSPEYETAAGFGSNCLNPDGNVVVEANDLCNRLGLDTISASGLVAFAMEAYERGIITQKDTDGQALEWGNGEAILSLVTAMAYRDHIGDLLAEGARQAAQVLGHNAQEFAVQVKGLELAYHDPRAFPSMGINYATANRGGCHLEGLTYFVEGGAFPAAHIGYAGPLDRFDPDVEAKTDLAVRMQNLMNVLNALGLCKFLIRGKVSPDEIARWVTLVTGWELTGAELLRIGARLHTLKRIYNVRNGISRKDDILPARLLTHNRGGGAEGSFVHLGKMLSKYYHLRGWDEEGIPTQATIRDLGLEVEAGLS